MRSGEWPAWFSFWFFGVLVLAGSCQRHGVGGFLLRNTTTTTVAIVQAPVQTKTQGQWPANQDRAGGLEAVGLIHEHNFGNGNKGFTSIRIW